MNTRKAAFLVISEIENKKNINADILMEKYHQRLKDPKDRKLFVELVHGVLRFKNLLDYYINFVATKGIKDKKILNILRVATYELIFLDKIPEYATVSEACNLAESVNRHQKGFVNAVLRNMIRRKDEIEKALERIKETNLKDFLSIKLSYPKFLIEYLEQSYGLDKTIRILEFLNTKPLQSVKINTKKISREEFLKKLEAYGYEYDLPELNSEIVYILSGNIKESDLYKEGYFYFQDLASSLIVKWNRNDFENAKSVLDLCAAPGGKTFNCAEVTKGFVVSCDVNRSKVDLLRENLLRLGFDNVIPAECDATVLNEDFIGKFDIVIADLPCTGFGTIRKKPDIKWNKTHEDIESLHELQVRMLDNAAKYVKNGGIIFYSTCTLGHRENEDTVSSFVERHEDFSVVYQKTIFPDEYQCDGFFIAKLKKEGKVGV
ncbi:16S rRNA (cytosine(967)-C(5))-methyltransferase RsmB [Caldicellulosiruptor naganoensis]|uniref:16S rRNA (cytosine(967)-C(5))-methyltransferase n=1 Tax=Caldicellulosiruptor naganoensis TaxID=29324 RepID=A0ABY7BIM6_9FIRM|nr:16S rRNA (cytosine(967)-C(5))-methyltransferase RsmB [Caldicellulosiruptor naganoensis]WAM32693.1 16S rRNA (cytosine(967)-C(5))-methyltransferase RsmB [Caldicellulosiruptor naganoensis]